MWIISVHAFLVKYVNFPGLRQVFGFAACIVPHFHTDPDPRVSFDSSVHGIPINLQIRLALGCQVNIEHSRDSHGEVFQFDNSCSCNNTHSVWDSSR